MLTAPRGAFTQHTRIYSVGSKCCPNLGFKRGQEGIHFSERTPMAATSSGGRLLAGNAIGQAAQHPNPAVHDAPTDAKWLSSLCKTSHPNFRGDGCGHLEKCGSAWLAGLTPRRAGSSVSPSREAFRGLWRDPGGEGAIPRDTIIVHAKARQTAELGPVWDRGSAILEPECSHPCSQREQRDRCWGAAQTSLMACHVSAGHSRAGSRHSRTRERQVLVRGARSAGSVWWHASATVVAVAAVLLLALQPAAGSSVCRKLC